MGSALGDGAAIHDGAAASDGPGHGLTRRCPDCGTVLVGEFCHACGQSGHPHRSFAAIGHDFLHGVLHFDGKFWHTLPLLFWRPGDLTRRFIAGERAWFISPLALFLFAVFLGYIVANLGGHDAATPRIARAPIVLEDAAGKPVSDGAEVADAIRTRLSGLDRAIAEARAKGAPTDELESERTVLRNVAVMGAIVDGSEAAATGKGPPAAVTGVPWFDHAVHKVQANPSLVLYKLQTYAYKYAWAVIPLSMPFLWLLFPFSERFRMYDH